MHCPTCKHEVMAGTRWCPLCRGNVVDPSLGKLSPPFKRLGAYVIEITVFMMAVLLVGRSSAILVVDDAWTLVAGLVGGLLVLVAFLGWALVLFTQGTTPGKRILGMQVVKADGTAADFLTMLIRELVGKAISGVYLLLGFLWILLDSEKQGWHDKLMSTYVVDRDPALASADAKTQ